MRLGDTPAASATPLPAPAAPPRRAPRRRARPRPRRPVAAASREVMCTRIHMMCTLIHMVDGLRERIQRTRRVATPWNDDRTRGIGGTHLDELLEHWAKGYDWAVHERRIAGFPWVTVRAGDTDLRVIHQRSAAPGAPVVVLLHGWPDSVLRFERVLPMLADLHVVVPALPGFPFAAPLTMPGMSASRIAGVLADAFVQIGHRRYTVSGGDVGGAVAEILAAEHPGRVAALHLT